MLLLLLAAVLAIHLLADRLAVQIPFAFEQRIAASAPIEDEQPGPMQAYLQQLAERIAEAEAFDAGIKPVVHYVDDDTINAFATLGGHVVVFRGLLERMPHENALAMVMAHELAHLKHRDPIKGLSRAALLSLVMALVSSSGGEVAGNVLGDAGLLTTLSFSREQETAADAEALQALTRLYGHVQGAEVLFQILAEESGQEEGMMQAFFSTHPMNSQRIEAVRSRTQASAVNTVTPLPEGFTEWLQPNP